MAKKSEAKRGGSKAKKAPEKEGEEVVLSIAEVEEGGGEKVRRALFTALDEKERRIYVYLPSEEDEEEVLCLTALVDEDGVLPQGRSLEPIGADSPYLEAAEKYLHMYEQGEIAGPSDEGEEEGV